MSGCFPNSAGSQSLARPKDTGSYVPRPGTRALYGRLLRLWVLLPEKGRDVPGPPGSWEWRGFTQIFLDCKRLV